MLHHNCRQTQAVSCSHITQHATVKPPPNCRPDASWTSGPGKYLPKDTEVQSPEAAAAAKATIERVLKLRMCDPVFSKSLDTTEKKKVPKTAPIVPVSDPNPVKNELPKEEKEEEVSDPNEDSNPPLVRAVMPDGEDKAAKERFLNALARFQRGSASKPGQFIFRPQIFGSQLICDNHLITAFVSFEGNESNKPLIIQGSHFQSDKPLKYSENTNYAQKRPEGQTVQQWRKSVENTKTFSQTNQACKSSGGDHSLQQHHIQSFEHLQGNFTKYVSCLPVIVAY